MKREMIVVVFGVLTMCLGFSACTNSNNANTVVNANTTRTNAVTVTVPPAPAAGATPIVQSSARWSVVVCSSRASSVTLQAGPSKDDSATFATWKETSAQRIYDLPSRVQNLTSVYFQAIGSETNPVELCVLFDGKPKKRVSFEDGNEDHTIKSSDDNDSDCRCTQ